MHLQERRHGRKGAVGWTTMAACDVHQPSPCNRCIRWGLLDARDYRGGENKERAHIGMAKFWSRVTLAPVLKCRCKIWYKFPDCGTMASIDHEWWLLFPMHLWLVSAISYLFWTVA